MFRYFLFAFGLLFSLPLLILLWFVIRTPVSAVGIVYLLSYSLVLMGMILAPWQSGTSKVFILAGSLVAVITITIRFLFPPLGTQMNLITLPPATRPRLLNRIFDEQDIVLLGAQIAPYLGAISAREKQSLDLKFSQTFREMKSQGVTPLSPFLTTYLNQQRPNQFDVVVAEPVTGTKPEAALIFLHGFGGNFTLQCWLMAKAGSQINVITICPSTSPIGDWWSSRGQAILQETFVYLHQRQIKRIYLAGLSNGGIGSSRVADQYKDQLQGLILISGADPNATMTDLPVLLLHGNQDERIPVSMMEGYASKAGANATYHLFDGDHFLLLKQADRVQEDIVNWLREQESTGTVPKDTVPVQ